MIGHFYQYAKTWDLILFGKGDTTVQMVMLAMDLIFGHDLTVILSFGEEQYAKN